MALRKNRRSTRKIEDLPGLFDEFEVNARPAAPSPAPAPESGLAPMADEQRKRAPVRTVVEPLDAIDLSSIEKPRQLQFISFGSGSSGNCAYIGIAEEGGVLIDAGVDADKVIDTLKRNCIPLNKISGIILTHDHGDHVRYAYKMLRKVPTMQLYCTPRVITGVLRRHSISKRIKDYHKAIFKEFVFEAGPFAITPFEVSHDGTDNVGFFMSTGTRNFVVATDMGFITDRADYYMRQADFLMIESNYDARMLDTGTYPEYLKARIRGERGHLDNTVTAAYLACIWQPRLTDIYLCHLSQDNNRPDIALRVSTEALAARGITIGDASGSVASRQAQVRLSVLPRFDASPLFIHRL